MVENYLLFHTDSASDRLIIRWQAIGWQVIYMGRCRGRRWCALGKEGTGRREQGEGNGEQGERVEMMNSELRKKTAERGETCSAKRTHASRKRKAGNGKSQSKGTGRREEGMRNRERITNHGPRVTNHAKRQWPNKAISAQLQGQQRESAGRASPSSRDGHARYRIIANWVQRHEIRSSFARGEVGGLRFRPRPTTMACEILCPSTLPEPHDAR